ncbi:MAG: putative DNA binding domain-containing protein [Actinobacteria bacterium]|nr:putative DNA binding domain-containing protein [Actinomycetota bacterium]
MDEIAGGSRGADLESAHLEFKRAKESFDDTARDLAEAVACFGNSPGGGTVVVGIDEKARGQQAFLGCPHDGQALRRRIWELTNPSLTVITDTTNRGGADLLVLVVPEGLEVHAVSGRAHHRVGTSCEPMSASEQARLVDDRRGADWSADATARLASEVSPLALAAARQLLRANPDQQRRTYGELSDADLLRALGVVSSTGELLRAGELLFCHGDHRDLIVYQFRRTAGGEPADVQRLGTPLLLALQRSIELVAARIERTLILLPSGQQVELPDLPEGPTREAIANAVAHRDWRLPDPISIEHSPTRLVVDSPGPLVAGVTVDNILAHPSKPRNRTLIEAIRKLGLAEQAGVGIDRMYRDMIRTGHQPPQITESDYVRVTLTGGAPNRNVARYVARLPPAIAEDVDAMLVLFTLLTQRTVTAVQLKTVLQKGAEEVEAVLSGLATDEVAMLEPTRQSVRRHMATYRLREQALRELGTAVPYRRRTSDEIDRKIVATVSELGQITNGVVQALLDVKVERASRILADLVDRAILVKTSSHERGPRVTYGPGPRFPARRAAKAPRGRSREDGASRLPLGEDGT